MDWSQIGSEGFARGIQSGGDFARAKLQLDQQNSQMQLQREQLEQTKRQNQIEMGKDMLTRVENATKMENGPAKNAYLKGMQKIFAQYGFDNTEMISAMLVDPQGLADFRTAFSQIYSLGPEQQNELWAKASQFLASPELNVYLKDFIAKMGEFERIKKENDGKAGSEGFKDASATFRDLRTSKPFTDYSEVRVRARSLLENLSIPDNGYAALTSLFDFMKMVDPASVVREGEQETFRKTGSLGEMLSNIEQQLRTGGSLQGPQREKLMQVVNGRLAQYQGQYKKFSGGLLDAAEKAGISRSAADPGAGFYDEDTEFFKAAKNFKAPGSKPAKIEGAVEINPDGSPKQTPTPAPSATAKPAKSAQNQNGLSVAGAGNRDIIQRAMTASPQNVAQLRAMLKTPGANKDSIMAAFKKAKKNVDVNLLDALIAEANEGK